MHEQKTYAKKQANTKNTLKGRDQKRVHKDSIRLFCCHNLTGFGLNGARLSYNQAMEMQSNKNLVQTKANVAQTALSAADMAEFRAYKRNKKLAELSVAIMRSEALLARGEDIQRVCERAVRLKQAAVKLPLTKLAQASYYLTGSGVKLDCTVGGDGETVSKVKAFEAKLAVKRGASEITLLVAPSLLDCCRYGEIRREIRRVKRAAGRAKIKVRVERTGSLTALGRIARIASDMHAQFFSVPYFDGCERLRLDLTNGCMLEVTGVEKKAQFETLIRLGVGRIVTASAWEIYNDWVREANAPATVSAPTPPQQDKTEKEEVEKAAQKEQAKTEGQAAAPEQAKKPNPETDYRCRLVGSDLKFF